MEQNLNKKITKNTHCMVLYDNASFDAQTPIPSLMVPN